MPIGLHVKKYQAEKAARAAESIPEEPVVPEVKTPDPMPASVPTMTQSDFLVAMQQLIATIKTNDDPHAKERALLEAERLALEHERLKREMPENKQAPGISVYSYPEGDLAHPKPDLKCKMYWIGYELNTDTLTPVEVDLLNRVQPGEFRVTKTDGTAIPFKVAAKYGDRIDTATDRPELRELSIWFPCKAADQKQNHASMSQYLQQVLGDRIPTNAELLAEVAQLRAQLAGASA